MGQRLVDQSAREPCLLQLLADLSIGIAGNDPLYHQSTLGLGKFACCHSFAPTGSDCLQPPHSLSLVIF